MLIIGSILGLLAVVLGAFGAHGLKESLTPEALNSFKTGVRYQMYHALLMLVAATSFSLPEKALKVLFYLLLSGILLFSGSIYLLTTRPLTDIDISAIAWVTPIGGALLIAGWALLVFNFIRFTK